MTPSVPERYRIEDTLGAGGMGVVYRATDTQLGRTVAVKLLDAAAGDARAPLLHEARAASALSHPFICTVFEVTTLDGRPCIVMEHVDGNSLAGTIPPEGLPPPLVIRLGIQVADALAHAHDRGVLHRDLKPANVMIARDGRVKVLDFGLARRVRESQREIHTEVLDAAAEPEAIGGTLPYMSPSVLEGREPAPADDVWSLGVMLYEMATGERPFAGATRFQLASSIQRDAPAPLPSRVPPSLRAVIMRCLARDRAVGYQHAHEVRAALEVLQDGRDRSATSSRRAAIAIALLVVVSVGALVVWGNRDRTP